MTNVFSYKLNEDENDIELTEEDVHNLLKAHQMSSNDNKRFHNDISNDDDEDNDDDDEEGEELTEDHIRELLQNYMTKNDDNEENEDDDQDVNDEDETALAVNNDVDENDDEDSEENEIELLDEVSII